MKRKVDGTQAQYCQRSAFNRQPARILVVDLQSSLDSHNISNLCSALENVLSMVTSLNGPNRIPFFGVIVLHKYPEVLFPLSPLRGNFARLATALNDIQRFHKDNITANESSPGLICEAIKEGLSMFRRQAQGLLQTAGYWAQLELTFVTGEQTEKIIKTLKTVIQQLDLDGLKKIQVVCFTGDDRLGLAEDVMTVPSQSSTTSDGSTNSHDSSGLVDMVRIENSVLCVERYFMSWLHDTGTDQEHAHIVLPANETHQSLTLKCDLQERILNPNSLPFSTYYDLGLDLGNYKTSHQPNVRASTNTIPLRTLHVIQRLPSEAVCESVLYGMPLIAKATSCWKIDWDELEANQHQFHALCQLLAQKNEVLVAQIQPDTSAEDKSGFRYKVEQPKPSGMFLLLPSERGSLLVKSLATRELLLPMDITSIDQIPEASINDVEQCLDKVELVDSYNPLLTGSNLHQSLQSHLVKNMSGSTTSRSKPIPVKPPTYVGASGSNVALNPGFTPAKWAMQNSHEQRRVTASAKDFYSKPMQSGPDDFPTEL